MSLEQSLDEDYVETLAMLDETRTDSPSRRKTSRSGQSPTSPGMLDVDSPTPRHGSIAGIGVGVTSPRQQDKKPKLDPADPSTWTRRHTGSKPSSPTLTKSQPAVTRLGDKASADDTEGYVGLPREETSSPQTTTHRAMSDSGPARPRDSPRSGALAAALSGELERLQVASPESSDQNLQKAAARSRSPSGRVHKSPVVENPAGLSPGNQTTQHRPSNSFSTIGSGSDADQVKDDPVGDELVVDESSDEEPSTDSEDDSRGRERGRKAEPSEEVTSPPSTTEATPTSPEPSISITSPEGEKMAEPPSAPLATDNGPQDRRASISTLGSTDGDENDIAKAKTLGLSISPLDTKVPDRHVRMIIRGDWTKFHKQAEAGERSVRTYLACSDLSNEANYALEWTVGTILRDGDTLLCMYSIEDEHAGEVTSDNKVTEAEKEQLHQEGAQAGKDAMDVMEGLTRQTTNQDSPSTSKFVPATEAKSATGSVDSRNVGKKELERLKAIDEISQTFLKLVRKTSLQVRCMIEVIHCKSPKHLILGAIDELEPTLAVVGTRGRSSLKGVLLGSFSNYLVTKSSVPVMVARRKLKKPRSSVRVSSNKIRLSNNLTASSIPGKRRSLTQARID